MNSTNSQSFESKLESYLLNLFRKIPLTLKWRAIIVGLLFYSIYFRIALLLGQLSIAFWSRMHLVLISFSVCITVSIYLWEKFQFEFIELMKGLEKIVDDTKKYEEFVNHTIRSFKSPIALSITVPLMLISGSYFYFGIYPKLPDDKNVAQKSTVSFFVLLKQPFKKFSDFPFKVSLYLLVIELTVLPILIYIIYFYNIKIGGSLMMLGILVLFLVISFIIYFFFLMNRSIHASILNLKSKEERFAEIISQLEKCEKEIREIKTSKFVANKINDLERLLSYHAYLDRVRREVLDVPEKTPKFVKISQLLASILPTSLLAPNLKLIIEHIISLF